MSPDLAQRVAGLAEAAGLEVTGHAARPEVSGDTLAAVKEDLASANGGTEGVVLLSSALVYGAWPDNAVPLAEDAPLRPNPGFFPAVERAEAERLVTDWSEAHPDTPVAILRPTVIVGAGWSPLDRAVTGMGVPRAADIGRPVQFVHVDDVAAAVVWVASKRLRGVFNVAPAGYLAEETMGELVGGVARLSLPRRLVRFLAAATRRVGGDNLRGRAFPYGLNPWVVASDRLRAAGWTPRYTSEEALVESTEVPRWSGLSPERRQRIVLGAAAAGLAGVAAGAAALIVRFRRRHR
jgi:nucleoside-diphosphate-sugar epimerase